MKKSEIAKNLNEVLNLYSDFVETGFASENDDVDFSYIDNLNFPEKNVSETDETNLFAEETTISAKDDISRKRRIIETAEEILRCNKCVLNAKRKVPGIGNPYAKIFAVTGYVSLEEEKEGIPFPGETGEFFKKWINAINLTTEDVFITNIVKCNSKNNQITKDAIEICLLHLTGQLEIVKPILILALGDVALSSLFRKFMDIDLNHGKLMFYNKIPVFATYNPQNVIQNPELKKPVWDDLKKMQMFLKENTPHAG